MNIYIYAYLLSVESCTDVIVRGNAKSPATRLFV